ncbi:MAG: MSCRAMM family protein [Fimbriimonas sp.]
MKRLFVLILGVAAGSALLWAQLGGRLSEDEKRRQMRVRQNEAMGMKGIVRGRVVFENGSPAVGFPVGARFKFHQTGAPGEGNAVTDAQGNYEIRGLASQEFFVGVGNSGKPYILPRPVLVSLFKSSSERLPDFVLRLGPEVTVRVKDAERGTPVPNLAVKVTDAMGMAREGGITDAKGEARFRADVLEFTLTVEDPNRQNGYGQAPGQPLGRRVELDKVKPVLWDVLAYRDWTQPHPAVFKGVVQDRSGAPVPGARVRMQRYNDSLTATADAKGRFEFKTFRIQHHEDPARGAALMATKGDARAFRVVSAQETWGTIRLVLGTEGRGLVTGRVVDQHGKPLSACRIHYWETFGIAVGSVQPSETLYTEGDGQFTLRDLHPGAAYTFSFGSYYDRNKPLGTVTLPKTGVYSLTQKGLDLGTIVVPTADRVIHGTIVDAGGRPVTEKVILNLHGEFTTAQAFPDAQGHFTFQGVVDEPTTLSVFVGEDGFYRTGSDSPDLLLKQEVKPGESRLEIKVKLRPAKS